MFQIVQSSSSSLRLCVSVRNVKLVLKQLTRLFAVVPDEIAGDLVASACEAVGATEKEKNCGSDARIRAFDYVCGSWSQEDRDVWKSEGPVVSK